MAGLLLEPVSPEDQGRCQPRGRGDTQGFCPLKIVDDVAVVQHAASEPSLCPQGDHAAEKRADDGRRERVCDLDADGLAANDPYTSGWDWNFT